MSWCENAATVSLNSLIFLNCFPLRGTYMQIYFFQFWVSSSLLQYWWVIMFWKTFSIFSNEAWLKVVDEVARVRINIRAFVLWILIRKIVSLVIRKWSTFNVYEFLQFHWVKLLFFGCLVIKLKDMKKKFLSQEGFFKENSLILLNIFSFRLNKNDIRVLFTVQRQTFFSCVKSLWTPI